MKSRFTIIFSDNNVFSEWINPINTEIIKLNHGVENSSSSYLKACWNRELNFKKRLRIQLSFYFYV